MVDQLMDYSRDYFSGFSQEQLRASNKNMLLCCCVGHVAQWQVGAGRGRTNRWRRSIGEVGSYVALFHFKTITCAGC